MISVVRKGREQCRSEITTEQLQFNIFENTMRSGYSCLMLVIYFSHVKFQANPCETGFYRQPNNKCVDDDECDGGQRTVEALCGINTVCNNTIGSYFCNCKKGYMNSKNESNFRNRTNCRENNECFQIPPVCGPNAICFNTVGSFYCLCKKGFITSGLTNISDGYTGCTDIDECENDPNICGSNATCTNNPGSFKCTCNDGFVSTAGGDPFTDKGITQCQDLIDFRPKSSSLKDINSFAEQSFTSFSKLCNTNSMELHKFISNFLEVMESCTIAAAQNLHHNEIKKFSSKNVEILMQAIRNNTFPKEKRSKLSTTKNSLDISWNSVAGKGNFDVAAVVLISYKHLDSLMEPILLEVKNKESKLDLISEVITVTVTNKDTKHLPDPVILTIENKFNNETSKCVFWDGSASTWSTRGCEVDMSNTTHTVCNCRHLTSFAVLMALDEIEESDGYNLRMITIFGILFSLVCLFISILTFVLCRAIKSIRTTIHTHLCISLFLADLLFIIGIDKTKNMTVCAIIAGFLHYLFLACFAWMLLEGVQLYLMVVKVFNAKSLRSKYMYLFGYGCPLIVVGISAAVFPKGYGTKKFCWLDLKSGFLWAFLAPVCVIILVNGGFFIITVWKLVNKFSSISPEIGQLKKIRVFTFTAVAQLCLLGCTWILGMLYFQKETIVMAYIFTVVNSLQGMFIFILHCLLNKQVRDEYAKFFLGVCYLKKASKYSEFSTSTTQGLKSMHETGM